MKRKFEFEYEYLEDGDVSYKIACVDEEENRPTYEDLFGAIEVMREDVIKRLRSLKVNVCSNGVVYI